MNRLLIHSQDDIRFIDPEDIMFCQSDNCYTCINLKDEEQVLVSKSLAKVSKELDTKTFKRVSQSYLVNINYIRSVDKKKKLIEMVTHIQVHFTCSIKELLKLVGPYMGIYSLIDPALFFVL